MHIFNNTHFDFLRWRWHAIALSWLIIIAGAVVFFTKGIPLGIEFAGGTAVIVQFDQPVAAQQVRSALDSSFPGGGDNVVIQSYGDPSQRQYMIRVPFVGAESGGALSATKQQVVDALTKSKIGTFKEIGTEIVGPAVGRELRSRGLWATVLSLIGILAYIAFRFQFSFGVGAVVATIHDLLVTVAFLAIFRYDMSLNVIAAILTMTGYSTNDTIVIFDRVRENLRGMRRDSLERVVNTSVNQTLGRTIITAGTTFLAVLSLYLFGGEVLEGFAFTMLVGIISGTYSTVFIAAAIAIILSGKQAKARAATPAARPPSGRKAS
jgi:preprotein translocase subunit SecF